MPARPVTLLLPLAAAAAAGLVAPFRQAEVKAAVSSGIVAKKVMVDQPDQARSNTSTWEGS